MNMGKAELRIDNARIVDVFNGTISMGSLSVSQGRILGFDTLDAQTVVDAQGAYLLPGLIDSHVHIESSMLCPARFAELILPFGTTAIIADPHEIANVQGVAGIQYMLDATQDLPLTVRIMLPSCVPALPMEDAGAVLTAEALKPLMGHARVGGLGEMMNVPGVLHQDPAVMAKLNLAHHYGKRIDGHAPGLRGRELDTYAAAGISTDHECTTPEELQDRIARGMYVLLREGSASRDVLHLLPGVSKGNVWQCLFCSDDRHPADIFERGHINANLRLAVKAGLEPLDAIRMATINAARCYGLQGRGGLAPGWWADMILVQDLSQFEVIKVWCAGQLVAQNGTMVRELPRRTPGSLSSSVNLAPLDEHSFELALPTGKARVIKLLPHSLITEESIQTVGLDEKGLFDFNRNPGMVKLAVIERHQASGKTGLGLLDASYGLCNGAIATTIAHDSHNLVVAGDNDDDMLMAAQELERLGGGIVMVAQGTVLASLPLPIGGLMTEADGQEVAEQLRRLLELARSHYAIADTADAFMTLSFLALPVIPHLKLTPRGLFDVDGFSFVDIAVS